MRHDKTLIQRIRDGKTAHHAPEFRCSIRSAATGKGKRTTKQESKRDFNVWTRRIGFATSWAS